MTCPDCGADSAGYLQYCPTCIQRKTQSVAVSEERIEAALNERQSVLPEGSLNIIFGALAIAAVIAYRFGVFGFGTLPSTSALRGSSDRDPCATKQRCIVAYVAPWCPACEGSIDFLNFVYQKVQKTSAVGMKVVIGSDAAPKLAAMASKFRAPTFLDSSGSYGRKAGVNSFPSIWVADDKGKILQRGVPGSVSGSGDIETDFQYYDRNYLKLTEYFGD